MSKKLFLAIGFVAIFFYQAPLVTPKILAASENSSSESFFERIWEAIISALFPKLTTIKIDGTKNSLISSQNSQQKFTEYGQQDKDWSHRTLPQSLRERFIGIWFNEVINKPGFLSKKRAYSDEIVSQAEGNCPEINISDIVYYFATKTDKKILYSRESSSPIDYPSNIDHPNSLGPGSCYENAYRGIQSVPQGLFEDQGDAALSSTQANDQLRYTLPQNLQDKPAPDNSSAQNTELLVEDTQKHLKITRVAYMPQDIKDRTDCSSNLSDEEKMYNLYKNFQKTLKPQKWIKANTDTDTTYTYQKGNIPDDCSLGSGMSQYGAEGMAMKGKTYTEILTAYYGIGPSYNLGMELGSVNSATDKITVKLERTENFSDGDSPCDALVNIYPDSIKFGNEEKSYKTLVLTVEDYVMGLGEIGLNWKLATHQALTVAARSYAYGASSNLKNSITDTSEHDQVFQCSRLLQNLQQETVQTQAVKLTTGVVLTQNGAIFRAQYLRCFGGPSNSPPRFDGSDYEKIANGSDKETRGTCDDYVPRPINNTNNVTSTGTSTISGLYIFPGSVHQGRIAEDYDLSTVDGGKWLQTYSGNCKLDSRIFPALKQLINDAQSQISGLTVNLVSCYRTIAEQEALFEDNPNPQTTAQAGKSAHHTGRAIDFGDPNKIRSGSKFYLWLTQNASKYGFYPYEVEAHHWEYNP